MHTHEPPKPKPAARRPEPAPRLARRDQLIPHALLNGGSNSLIGAYIARKPAVKAAPRATKDPAKLTDAELDRESDRVGKKLVDTDPAHRDWRELWDRSQELGDERERRYKSQEERELAQEGLDEADRIVTDAEAVNRELRELVGLLDDSLAESEAKLREYLGSYGEAYGNVTKALGKAKEDAAFREAIVNFCIGIAVGTGVGLVGGALFEGVKGLGKVMAEMGGELTEQAVANPLQIQSAAQFELPPGMESSVRAAAEWERMAGAWKSAALLNTVLLDFGDFRDHIRKSQGELALLAQGAKSPRGAAEVVNELREFKAAGGLGEIRAQKTAVREALFQFRMTMHHPVLRKIAYEIEQDIWIRWISGLRNGGPKIRLGGPVPAGLDPRVHDALDEDAVEDRLNAIGLIGEKSRLGVDFGINTTAADTGEAYDAAVKEQARVEQLGRIGVVIEPVQQGKPGVVHIRSTAYELAGRPEPEPGMPEGYFRAVARTGDARRGQVVSVQGTSLAGLEVSPVIGATGLGNVSPQDEANAKAAQ